MMSRRLILSMTLVTASLVLAGCAPQAKQVSTGPVEEIKAPVETIAIRTVPEVYEVAGTVASKQRMQVSSKVMGRITELDVHEGDRVRMGQLLFRIDSNDAAARLQASRADLDDAQSELNQVAREQQAAHYAKSSAEADLLLARQNYNRYAELVKRDSVSRQEFDNANAKFHAALAAVEQAQQTIESRKAQQARAVAHIERSRAAVKEAQAQLSYTQILAPGNGVVAGKQATVGDMATPGTPILTVDAQSYRLEVPVDQSRLPYLRRGSSAFVTIEGVDGQAFVAPIDEIVPAADPASRSSIVKLQLPAIAGLHSGLFGRARFDVGQREALAVPVQAVVHQGQLTLVYVLDAQGIARLRLVKLGRATDGQVEVLSGVAAGEKIVAAVSDRLHDGDKVVM